MTTELVRYDAMIHAIAECHRVDEVKDIRDKAAALEAYAKQARNTDAERKANEIRLRAERKAGDLLAAIRREQGKRTDMATLSNVATKSEYAETLGKAGLSRQTAHAYQALANVPEDEFEAALAAPDKPTTTGLIKTMNGSSRMDDDSLWIWGRLRDFERRALGERAFIEVFDGMTESMQIDMRRIVPSVIEWLSQFKEEPK